MGAVTGISGAVLAWRRTRGEQTQSDLENYWTSYRELIELAEGDGDDDNANAIRREFQEHLRAWQSQQALAKSAPREISEVTVEERRLGPTDEPRLGPQEAELKQLLDRSEGLSPALLSAGDYFLRGNAYYEAGQYEQALAAYSRALDLRPNDAATLMSRGVTLGRLERYDDALADYNRALEIRPDDAETIYSRGNTLYYLGRDDDAVEDYKRALELRPGHAKTLMNLAMSLHHLGRNAEALDNFSRAIEQEPRNILQLLNRATLETKMGDTAAAAADLSRALNEGDLAGFRRKRAKQAATHPYFEPLRVDPSIRKLFEEIVGKEATSQ